MFFFVLCLVRVIFFSLSLFISLVIIIFFYTLNDSREKENQRANSPGDVPGRFFSFFLCFLPLGASLRWVRSHQVRPCIVHLGIFVCGNLTSGPLVRRKAELELLVTNQP